MPEKFAPHDVRLPRTALKVIRTDTDQSATYDFPLVIHSNSMRLSCTISEAIGDVGLNLQIFPTLMHSTCGSVAE